MRTDRLASTFRDRYRREPLIGIAPGRVNLIGEHTDYNDGFVLPAAIDRYVAIACAPNDEGLLRGYSLDFDEERETPMSALAPGSGSSWFQYVAGVALALDARRGFDFAVAGNVPMGAGLASSAALELATARALADEWDPIQAALAAQRAENEYVGVRCGIMDQMAASVSKADHALLLDCRSLSFEHVPLPRDVSIVVMDTGERRTLAESAYNERRRRCEEAASILKVAALRDATEDALEESREALEETTYRRALHVIQENARTLQMASALRRFDRGILRDLMARSHESLRQLYEVSSPALDRMVEIAMKHEACLGARMTGAGFGGSAVALVDAPRVTDFVGDVEGMLSSGRLYVCRAVEGARLLGGPSPPEAD